MEELADRLGISVEEVVEGMAASNAYTASSLDAQPEEDDTEGALADRIGYEDNGLEGIEYVESLKPLIAELPPRDRRILSLRFVANMTQARSARSWASRRCTSPACCRGRWASCARG